MRLCLSSINTLSAAHIAVVIMAFGCGPKNDQPAGQGKQDKAYIYVLQDFVEKDQSPLDISYCPSDFPQRKLSGTATNDQLVARVIYSRPHKKNRVIFGTDENSLCRYGIPWRLGANESTEIEFFNPVSIGSNQIPPGKYVMYAIPFAHKWVLALNTNLYSWGLQIDSTKDIFRASFPVEKQQPALEDFTIVFETSGKLANMTMAWDDVKVVVPIHIK
jgi:hypothetical protein